MSEVPFLTLMAFVGRTAAENFLGRPGNIILSLEARNYFSQPGIDRFMLPAVYFNNFQPIFCGNLFKKKEF